jgi:nicotinate-nucleotide adenylyltransferase
MPVPALMLPDPQGRRIGLFGGSFNPAHNGHAALAREALRRLSLDQVWWMVSPQNPLKDPRDTEDFDERFAAVKAIARHPRMRVLDIEARLDSRTTAETLRRLAAVFRRGRFVWIMGADSFAGVCPTLRRRRGGSSGCDCAAKARRRFATAAGGQG